MVQQQKNFETILADKKLRIFQMKEELDQVVETISIK